ncbi:MAG: SpoIID/LytB domain-containing protein [bacterium]
MTETNNNLFLNYSEANLITYKKTPKVRLLMVGHQEFLDFEMQGSFSITDKEGNQLVEDFASHQKWRAQVDAFAPSTYQYILFVVEVLSEQEADEISEDLKAKGYEAWHRRCGYKIELKRGHGLFENYRYRVFIGPVPNKQTARGIQTELLGIYRSQIMKVPYLPARGYLEITDLQVASSHKGVRHLRVEPTEKDSTITVFGILNQGKYVPYTFHHAIEFHIADDGRLFLVGEMDVDEYVIGVVTAMFDPDYPEEFLKASIVAYHSAVLSNLGMIHFNEPYDYCRSQHCFEFEWQDKVDPKIKKIMKAVSGKFLLKNRIICDARQHPLCGGHTEHINLIMNRSKIHADSGRYDIEDTKNMKLPKNLSNETDAEEWISSRPSVLCNYRDNGVQGDYDRYRQDFRWVVELSRLELDQIVRRKTEEDIGVIFDIVPLRRGGSGRLLEVEVLGSHKNVLLMDEQDIRSTLSETVLPSSLFSIETELGVDGAPSNFIFSGAGKGHGVGMCQAGAVAIAHRGYDFLAILKHYFGQVELVSEFPSESKEKK